MHCVTEELSNHQRLLMEIRDKLCGENAAELARRIGKDATYVNRLFYPEGKPGRKGIGLEIMAAANKAFYLPPGFWDMPWPAMSETMLDAIQATRNMRTHFDDEDRRQASDRLDHIHEAGSAFDSPMHARSVWSAQEPRAAYGMEPILAWEHPDELPEGDYVMVPRLNVHLSAGGGREQVEIDLLKENPQAFRAEWFREQGLKPGKCAAMRASGNSMEKTIFHGDSLLVDTSQTTVTDDWVYALWYDGGERVKRLFRMPGGGLRIVSDNLDKSSYPDIVVKPEELEHVRIIGRVVHKSGRGGL